MRDKPMTREQAAELGRANGINYVQEVLVEDGADAVIEMCTPGTSDAIARAGKVHSYDGVPDELAEDYYRAWEAEARSAAEAVRSAKAGEMRA